MTDFKCLHLLNLLLVVIYSAVLLNGPIGPYPATEKEGSFAWEKLHGESPKKGKALVII